MDTAQQPALFHERLEQALDEVISAYGGRKKMALELWPDKPQRDAHNLLDACLNPERREKFSPHQLLYILRKGREIGCHSAMRFINDEVGYAAPLPLNPQDEASELQRKFIESVAMQKSIADRIERLTRAPLQSIKNTA